MHFCNLPMQRPQEHGLSQNGYVWKLRNPIFGNVLIALYKEIYLILRSEKLVFIIKGFNLVLGFPNTKYPPNTKNYLPCLLL